MMKLIHRFYDVIYVLVYVYVVVDVEDHQAGREPLQQVVCIAPFDEQPGQLHSTNMMIVKMMMMIIL